MPADCGHVLSLRTPQRHGYSLQFSPFFADRVAVVGGQHYGIVGCGSLFLLRVTPEQLLVERSLQWNQTLFGAAWSELNEHVLLTAAGDGSLQLWDLAADTAAPARLLHGHSKEASSVSWCPARGSPLLLSTSWDETALLWDASRAQPLQRLAGHSSVVYAGSWNAQAPALLVTGAGDQTARVWDSRQGEALQVLQAHSGEVLAVDWSKYDEHTLLTAATDRQLRVWDVRSPRQPLTAVTSGSYPVRCLRSSPFRGDILVTAGYDFSVRVWSLSGQCLQVVQHHTEFTCGVDFNLHVPGQLADCSWDETVKVYHPQSLRL